MRGRSTRASSSPEARGRTGTTRASTQCFETLLERWLFESVRDAREASEAWLHEYNQERPHGSLGGLPPSTFFERWKEPEKKEAPDGQAQSLTPWLVPFPWACQSVCRDDENHDGSFRPAATRLVPPEATKAEIEEFRAFTEALNEVIFAEQEKMFHEMVREMIPIMTKYLSLDQIQELNKFYSTPTMRHMTKALPKAMSEMQPLTLKYVQKSQERIALAASELIDAHEARLSAVGAGPAVSDERIPEIRERLLSSHRSGN